MTKNSARTYLPRYAPGWSMPTSTAVEVAPHQQAADPNGNRAQRRRAKKLGIKGDDLARRTG